MQPRLLHSLARAAPMAKPPFRAAHFHTVFARTSSPTQRLSLSPLTCRRSITLGKKQRIEERTGTNSYAQPAHELNQEVTEEEAKDYEERVVEDTKAKQIRTPWHREGSDQPPVARQRSAGAMTKGTLAPCPIPHPGRLSADTTARETLDYAQPHAQFDTPSVNERPQ